MKIVFLDAKTIGEDIDLSGFDKLGEVVKYGFSTIKEARERTADADVVILNKVPVNEESIGKADKLKLVCVTATGTDNLDKAYLEERGIAWRNVTGYSIPQSLWRSIHSPCCYTFSRSLSITTIM